MMKTPRFRRHTGLLLILFYVLTSGHLQAQILPYAKEVVKTLSSEEFKGRGYVENGDKIAADYIAGEFSRLGLKHYSNDYFQEFELAVNTFPDEITLIADGDTLKAGYDFHVNPASSSVNGEYEVVSLSLEELLNEQVLIAKLRTAAGKFLVFEDHADEELSVEQRELLNQITGFLKYHPGNPAAGTIELTTQKLTWFGSPQQAGKPSFSLHADSVETPISRISVDLNSKLLNDYATQNVIGYLEGENTDSMIVLLAHYDHFGKMGSAYFPGANDNASGIAMLLSVARHFSQHQPEYNMAFIAFGGEEIGLLGSKYFVENPLFDLSEIKFLLNFDLAGTGDEGIQVVNGSVYQEEFDLLTAINEEQGLLPQVKIRGAACNSDHCNFDQAGIPGFYIYTLGGIRAYHDVYDRYETLPFTEFEDYYRLVIEFISSL